jgi:hypothetical protein
MLQPHPAADAVRTPAITSQVASMPAPLCLSIPANGRPPIKMHLPQQRWRHERSGCVKLHSV